MTAIAERRESAVARPLSELKPLILVELERGDQAGIPHYTKAGFMLKEARSHDWDTADDYWEWATRSFKREQRQLKRYIQLADATEDGKLGRTRPASIREALGESGHAQGKVSWQAPVQEKLQAFNWERYNQDQADKAKEKALIQKLILEMLDIGYKVLANKFHPDKPTGSKEAMARLNEARRQAKEAVS